MFVEDAFLLVGSLFEELIPLGWEELENLFVDVGMVVCDALESRLALLEAGVFDHACDGYLYWSTLHLYSKL